MGTLTYPNKSVSGNGGSTYVEGNTVPANELQDDFDAVATVINGGIDNSNIAASAAIEISKLATISGSDIDDYSATAAEAGTQTTPGDTSSVASNLATTMDGEIERLRYRIDRLTRYAQNNYYMNTSDAIAGAAWVEPPIQGGNLLVNSGFEGVLETSGDPPYGWTEVGALTSSSMVSAPDINGHDARAFSMQGGSGAGISQTLSGLKDGTKYLFGVTYVRQAGTVTVSAASNSGGLGTGVAYQDPTYSESSSSGTATVNLIFKTATAAEDVTFNILSGASSGDIDIVEAWVHELNENRPAETPTGLIQTATHNTQETIPSTFTSSQWNYDDVDELDIAQFIPGPGYRLIYEAQLSFGNANTSGTSVEADQLFRLMLDTGGGDAVVDGPYIVRNYTPGVTGMDIGGVVTLRYYIDNPTPGLTYDFSVNVGAYNDGAADSQIKLNPLLNSVQSISRAWLRLERI